MRTVNLEQGSSEWLDFRRYHIMATDCACIMGVNDFKTPYDLYQEKVDGVAAQDNEHMRRGRLNEPLARQIFIEMTCIDVEPMVVQSSEFPFMGASLDGIDQTRKLLVEIKSPANIQKHLSKEIPIHYRYQMMHQLAVTRADCCYFVSFHADDVDKIIVQEVLPDRNLINAIIENEQYFYDYNMCLGNPPEKSWSFVMKK